MQLLRESTIVRLTAPQGGPNGLCTFSSPLYTYTADHLPTSTLHCPSPSNSQVSPPCTCLPFNTQLYLSFSSSTSNLLLLQCHSQLNSTFNASLFHPIPLLDLLPTLLHHARLAQPHHLAAGIFLSPLLHFRIPSLKQFAPPVNKVMSTLWFSFSLKNGTLINHLSP